MAILRFSAIAVVTAALSSSLLVPAAIGQVCPAAADIPRSQLLEAMRVARGYRLTSTSTAPLFGAQTLVALVKQRERDFPGQAWFTIHHADWFEAHREVAGATYREMSIAARAAHEHGQDVIVHYGGDIVSYVGQGAPPTTAIDVKIYPEPTGQAVAGFSYHDSTSIPEVTVYDEPIIRFKLLEFPGMLVMDEVEGLSVRPAGFFSLLFALFGNAAVEQNRIAVSSDYWQVMVGRGRFVGFSKTRTVTVEPNGLVHEHIPRERPDLRALEDQLRRPLAIHYRPSGC